MPAFLTPRIAKLLSLPTLTVSLLLASPGAHAATPAKAATQMAESTISQLMDRWTPFVQEAARRFNIAEDWITAVMRMESGGRTEMGGKPITSKAGAVGLMQVMPQTYKDMRAQYGLGANPHDPHDNVLAGAAYLKWLHDKYGYPKMFAAYNAGPGTVEAQMAGKTKLPAETQAYVKGISRILGERLNVVEARTEKSQRAATYLSEEKPSRISVTYVPAEPVKVIATLTRPDGSPVTVDGATVDSIRASLPDEYAPGVHTVIAIGNQRQGVCEDPATVALLLKHPVTNV
jgi:soluble lytic murein transglycosylase-like protein